MSNPWGKIGAWAAESERAEAEERESSAAAVESQTFPSLRESAAAATTKQKKKTKMSLQEFYGSSTSGEVGLTHGEMVRLPTGPKERSAEEMQYGRGFSSYGGGGRSGGSFTPGRTREMESDDSSWGNNRRSYGGFDSDRRDPPPSRSSDFDQRSRADEVDNWAQGKKSLPSFDSGRPNRYSSLASGGGGGGVSRSDEVDNWTVMKKPAISHRPSDFGSGFRDSKVDIDRWTRGGMEGRDHERPKLVLNPQRKEEEGEAALVEVVKTNRPNPFGAARPREEVLAEKGLDWKKMDSDIEAKKTSRPTSSQSSRPGSAQSSRSEGPALQGMEGVVKLKPKVNPFGDAKPREVLLEEKGLDWRKIDLELDHCRDRSETEAEKNLREDIENLKKELEKESASIDSKRTLQGPGEGKISLRDLILHKERELELLIHELDNKVRFGQKVIERPGSGAGRVASYPERQPSRPGAYDETRGVQFMERPRSHGTGEAWTRQGDDSRAFQGSRDRAFSGSYPERQPSRPGAYDETRGVQFMERPRSHGTGEAWTRQGDDSRAFQGSRDRAFSGNRNMDRSRSRDR